MVSYGGSAMEQAENAARAAAFGRAKDQAGQVARSGVDATSNEMALRGLAGSGIEGSALGSVIGGSAGQLGDFTREQLIQDLDRARQVADMQYQGNITQRGQNMGLSPAILGLIGSRGLY